MFDQSVLRNFERKCRSEAATYVSNIPEFTRKAPLQTYKFCEDDIFFQRSGSLVVYQLLAFSLLTLGVLKTSCLLPLFVTMVVVLVLTTHDDDGAWLIEKQPLFLEALEVLAKQI